MSVARCSSSVGENLPSLNKHTFVMKRRNIALNSHKHHSSALRPFESPSCVLYAIELKPEVMLDPAFASKNRGWIPGMPLPHIYIGMTSLTPSERFRQHKDGSKNVSRIPHQFGVKLRMDLVPASKPVRRTIALQREKHLAKLRRSQGYAVWQA